MKYAQIENGLVVSIMTKPTEGRILVPENVACGMMQNADGTFSNPVPTEEQLMEQLRIQRNQLLAQTDWRMTTDYPYADQPAWASYRTQLRDLPATATPTLDENGNLIVDWPTAPIEV